MPDSIHHPHDKLIGQVLSDLEEAARFLQAYLPQELSQKIDWKTLTQIKGTFIDEEYEESASDLLYLVQELESQVPLLLYILLEHQSTVDKWMRFRLLKYMCRIWDESFKQEKLQELKQMLQEMVGNVAQKGATGGALSLQGGRVKKEYRAYRVGLAVVCHYPPDVEHTSLIGTLTAQDNPDRLPHDF